MYGETLKFTILVCDTREFCKNNEYDVKLEFQQNDKNLIAIVYKYYFSFQCHMNMTVPKFSLNH